MDAWETTVRTAASTMLRYPEKLSDGLEAELYALLEKLGAATAGRSGDQIMDQQEKPDDGTIW